MFDYYEILTLYKNKPLKLSENSLARSNSWIEKYSLQSKIVH
jgi:hypothetical protein